MNKLLVELEPTVLEKRVEVAMAYMIDADRGLRGKSTRQLVDTAVARGFIPERAGRLYRISDRYELRQEWEAKRAKRTPAKAFAKAV